jgi:hypothetical protein
VLGGLSLQIVASGLGQTYTPATAAVVQDAVGAVAQASLPAGAPLSVSLTPYAYAAFSSAVLQGTARRIAPAARAAMDQYRRT